MPIFKALHILSMITMVMIFSGGELYYALAIQTRDVRALAWLNRTDRRFGIAFVALGALIAGVVFGLLTAATEGLDFFDGWLIAAYLLVGLFFVNAAIFARPMIRLADKAVEAEAGRASSEEVVREMGASRGSLILFVGNALIFGAIILDMVLKPF
jgi:uncharacterized membrane protein